MVDLTSQVVCLMLWRKIQVSVLFIVTPSPSISHTVVGAGFWRLLNAALGGQCSKKDAAVVRSEFSKVHRSFVRSLNLDDIEEFYCALDEHTASTSDVDVEGL